MLIGLIGKANVGKSTFFSASTDNIVNIANYPFTTVKPNLGICHVRVKCVCTEFGVKDNPVHSICIDGIRFVPVQIIDVAGLVPGAHEGKGLGNKFLDDARQADGLIHVIDVSGSTDSEGKPLTPGTGDPLGDIKFVEEEFDMWLVSIIRRDWDKIKELDSSGLNTNQILKRRLSGLGIRESAIDKVLNNLKLQNKKIRSWTEQELLDFCTNTRKIVKPVLIAANKADILTSQDHLKKIMVKYDNVIACTAELEMLLRKAAKNGFVHYLPGDNSFEIKENVQLTEKQRSALQIVSDFIKKHGSTGVQDALNVACFDLLRKIVVYPVEDESKLTDKKGNILPEAYLLNEESTAKDLANAIHDELGRGFLFAIDVRTRKRLGADYKLKNNDVIKIVSATSRK
ncbi:MAG: redox-regulated ATPase YchF [Thaumarchaeota archaeon]|nr:MAG: redox-regulated ATPase YchF [Nitrososphaerota archaeon]TLX90791.1 MAG: redox-regulated ATPase YchF [Nitrososphaerota archaeon]